MNRTVHFIYLGGEFCWQHWRAVETARRVHQAEVVIWHADEPDSEHWDALSWADRRPLNLPSWLADHPIQLANVKDLYCWEILYIYGGIYLDLDTVSLQPCWDLLTRHVVVSQEYPTVEGGVNPYNSAVVLGREGAPVLKELRQAAHTILESGEPRWGKCGPHLLTDFVPAHHAAFDVAPFRVLNGWNDETIRDYYAGARPGPDVRVLHLFSSSNMDAFHADRWMP